MTLEEIYVFMTVGEKKEVRLHYNYEIFENPRAQVKKCFDDMMQLATLLHRTKTEMTQPKRIYKMIHSYTQTWAVHN